MPFFVRIWVTANCVFYKGRISNNDGSSSCDITNGWRAYWEGFGFEQSIDKVVCEQQFKPINWRDSREAVNGFPVFLKLQYHFAAAATFNNNDPTAIDTLMKLQQHLKIRPWSSAPKHLMFGWDKGMDKHISSQVVVTLRKVWNTCTDLNRVFIERNLSIGSSADTLIWRYLLVN